MSLTVKHLNSDASFLLSFQPVVPYSVSPPPPSFTILLDPWLDGPSKIWHPKFSISTHKVPSHVPTLRDLPEPDLVIVSQDKTDHCHEQTLRGLAPSGGKTLILAAPGADKAIRGWRYFDPAKVVSMPRWEEEPPPPSSSSAAARRRRRSGGSGNSSVLRFGIPALTPHGMPGEVSVAFIPQRHDLTGLHAAVGITYRPPAASRPFGTLPATPPASPTTAATTTATTAASPLQPTLARSPAERSLSVLFSPHGCAYDAIAPYAAAHLVAEAALPLTALLHCFDRATNPWWLGGNICAGLPGGAAIARALLARCWVGAHDGAKETRGFASTRLSLRQFARAEVERAVGPAPGERFPRSIDSGRRGTDVVVLGVGEEMVLGPAPTRGGVRGGEAGGEGGVGGGGGGGGESINSELSLIGSVMGGSWKGGEEEEDEEEREGKVVSLEV